jgi:PPK2 family polyphosphate:nucleotide phosphotransferase
MPRTPRFAQSFRVTDGARFRLKDVDPADTLGFAAEDADKWRERHLSRLTDLQEKLYAQDQWGLLLIFQAMDAAGKDGTIKHVMSGVNPQGCQVYSFKAPSAEELDHDFLWRTTRCLPERGRIGVFNRSYYEEVLVVRVHPELLDYQKVPKRLVTRRIWQERFTDIVAFERYATRNGIAIIKFFLHVSKEQQKRRFLRRLEDPAKNWKFSLGDAKERRRWKDYMRAYEDMVRHTSSDHAPWYIVPADHKWFTRLVVAAAVIDALEEMSLAFPKVDREKRRALEAARAELLGSAPGRTSRAARRK